MTKLRHISLSDSAQQWVIGEKDTHFHGTHYVYENGEVVRTTEYAFPKQDMPEGLVIVLCEAENLSKLQYEHESLIWDLLDLEQYEL